MSELNEPQLRAVRHPGGPLLVYAGAGSGKTRVITHRIASLLRDHQENPFRILAVTFTNKAAGEMKKRLEQLAGVQATRDLWVGTFHSICAKLLRRHHAEAGLDRQFVIYDDSDQRALMKRVIKNLGLDEKTYPHRLMLSRVHLYKREGIEPKDFGEDDSSALDIFRGYDHALRTANAVDFEDLILLVMRIAEDPQSAGGKELRERFDHVLVDEFQDTNRTQYRLVRALSARSRNLVVVGDDDQSIYSWRGASIENIRGFRRDFKDAEVVKLEQNYRSTGNVVRAALAVIAPSRTREPKELWTENASGAPIVVRAVRDERAEGAYVAAQIKKELLNGTAADEVAVFYRINAQSRVIEEALRSERIAYQVIGGMKFFERAEVKDLLSYLRLIDNPRSDADLVRVINVPARGIGNKTIERLLDTAFRRDTSAFDAIEATLKDPTLAAGARNKLSGFRDLLLTLRESARTCTPFELAGEVLEKTGYKAALEAEDTAESDARLENLQELLGSIREYELDAEQAGDPANISGYLERVSLVSDIDGLKDEPQVRLMTVHSAKGLEFQTVFLTGMEEEMFPYRGVDGENNDELEEERRLAYVAITRARQRLHITHAHVRMLFGSTRYQVKSRFLECLPAEVIDEQVFDPWSQGDSGRSNRVTLGAPNVVRTGRVSMQQSQEESRIDYGAFDDMQHDAEGPRLGSPVFHKRYGRGVVEKVELGEAPKITARFPGFGSRKVLAQYLRFE
ncbi:MAG TPA: UvrD-helicase domain-containing protein [Polyangiaceae bacterium]|nr:UvrD-helicase domain-containing protein [Polyangiaceae bacterium]